jgi:hypothetical protein
MSDDDDTKGDSSEHSVDVPKGNDSARYAKLLTSLDEKLQLGLLTPLRRVSSYFFEGSTLFLNPATTTDREYLAKESVQRQLAVYANDACGVDAIAIEEPRSEKT